MGGKPGNKIIIFAAIFCLFSIAVRGQTMLPRRNSVTFETKKGDKIITITKPPHESYSIRYIDLNYPIEDSNEVTYMTILRDYGWCIGDSNAVFLKINNSPVLFSELQKYKEIKYVKDIKYIDRSFVKLSDNKKYTGKIEINIIIPKSEVRKRGGNRSN